MALGEEQVYGSDVYGTVGSGGEMLVDSGGAASDTTVDSGGFEYVFSGGTASNTTVSGGTLELGAAGVVDSSGGADAAGPDTNPSSDFGRQCKPGGNAGDADALASGGAGARFCSRRVGRRQCDQLCGLRRRPANRPNHDAGRDARRLRPAGPDRPRRRCV